eukprot:scaffold70866_cov37-Prasinocladus_malaysianus.AAC.1
MPEGQENVLGKSRSFFQGRDDATSRRGETSAADARLETTGSSVQGSTRSSTVIVAGRRSPNACLQPRLATQRAEFYPQVVLADLHDAKCTHATGCYCGNDATTSPRVPANPSNVGPSSSHRIHQYRLLLSDFIARRFDSWLGTIREHSIY